MARLLVSGFLLAALCTLGACTNPHRRPEPRPPADTAGPDVAPAETARVVPHAGSVQAGPIVAAARTWLYRSYDLKLELDAATKAARAPQLEALQPAQAAARAALVTRLRAAGLDPDPGHLANTLRGLLQDDPELVLLGPGPLARYLEAASGEELPGLRVVRVQGWRRQLLVDTPVGSQSYAAVEVVEVVLEDELGYRVRRGVWRGGVPLTPVEVHGSTLFLRRDTVEELAELLFFGRIAELQQGRTRLQELLAGEAAEGIDAGLLAAAKDALRWRQYASLYERLQDLPDAERRAGFADAFLAAEERRAAIRLAFVRDGTADLVAAEAVALLAAMAADPLDALAVACGLRAQVLAAPEGSILPPVGDGAAAAIAALASELGSRTLLELVDAEVEALQAAALRALGE